MTIFEGYRLYARPSFFEGVARLSDSHGLLNKYNRSSTPNKADAKAIASDWLTVGNIIREAMNSVTVEKVTKED